MTKWMLAAGAAALAMTSPTLAEKGGKGHEKGGQHAKAERGGGGKVRMNDHGGRKEHAKQPRVERRDQSVGQARRDAKPDRSTRMVDRNDGKAKLRPKLEGDVKRRFDDRGPKLASKVRDDVRFAPRWDNGGLVRFDGCPPGLAKKGNGCLPPGQAKKLVGTTASSALASRVLSGPYRDWYRDDDRYFYRWDNDYIYRVDRNGGLIDALFPYANRDYYYYPVGYQYPQSYNYYNVPYQYRVYYPDNGDMWYRYGDGAIYSVNPNTGLIQGITALLAGDLAMGQPLPSAYSVYNVPLSYRDRYYDTPDNWYRYNDGYIYRVDPTTQLITAVISAIV